MGARGQDWQRRSKWQVEPPKSEKGRSLAALALVQVPKQKLTPSDVPSNPGLAWKIGCVAPWPSLFNGPGCSIVRHVTARGATHLLFLLPWKAQRRSRRLADREEGVQVGGGGSHPDGRRWLIQGFTPTLSEARRIALSWSLAPHFPMNQFPPIVCWDEGANESRARGDGAPAQRSTMCKPWDPKSEESYLRPTTSLPVLRFVSYSNNSFTWTLQNTHLYILFCSPFGICLQPVHSLFSKFFVPRTLISHNEVLHRCCSHLRRCR